MKKYSLNTEVDYDFLMLGISCHYRDYRMAWLLNQHLEINFSKTDPYTLFEKKNNQEFEFPLFIFDDEENYLFWNLVSNKTLGQLIIPEKKEFDYFVIIKGSYDFIDKDQLINKIKNIPGIILCSELFPESLKSKKNLFFE